METTSRINQVIPLLVSGFPPLRECEPERYELVPTRRVQRIEQSNLDVA